MSSKNLNSSQMRDRDDDDDEVRHGRQEDHNDSKTFITGQHNKHQRNEDENEENREER